MKHTSTPTREAGEFLLKTHEGSNGGKGQSISMPTLSLSHAHFLSNICWQFIIMQAVSELTFDSGPRIGSSFEVYAVVFSGRACSANGLRVRVS